MHQQDFFHQALVYLLAAVISVPVAKRLGFGSVLGYLLAGIIIGPFVLELIGSEGEDVMHFAEFGVVMMLLLIGLELKPNLLWQMRKSIFGLGGLQLVLSALVIGGIAILLGSTPREGLAIGLMLGTLIHCHRPSDPCRKRTDETGSRTGLLFSTPVPGYGGHSHPGTDCLCWPGTSWKEARLMTELRYLAGIPITRMVPGGADPGGDYGDCSGGSVPGSIYIPDHRTDRPEGDLYCHCTSAWSLPLPLLMDLVGLSPALGAFLAGVVLANNEYRHELEADIEPFKGLLLGLFFISVGASINFNLLLANAGT